MSDPKDDERTRKARQRSGTRSSGKMKMSPVKQREKSSKACVQVFKHNIVALNKLKRECERLDAVANARLRETTQLTTLFDSPIMTRLSGDDFIETTIGVAAAENRVDVEAVRKDDGSTDHYAMDVDGRECSGEHWHTPGNAIAENEASSDRAIACGELPAEDVYDEAGSARDDMTHGSEESLISTPTKGSIDGERRGKAPEAPQKAGPTDRSLADTRHWKGLLPKLCDPYLKYLE
jgi:hypothetical protein